MVQRGLREGRHQERQLRIYGIKIRMGGLDLIFKKAMMVQERLLPQDIQLDKGTDFRCSID